MTVFIESTILFYLFILKNAFMPGYSATSSSSSAILRTYHYLATRSLLAGAPVLICPAFTATTISAIVVSSVSP